MKDEELRYTWPLHWAVFTSDLESLKKTLEKPDSGIDIDKVDARGRTALMLAVTLDKPEMASELLKSGANAGAQNKGYWSVSHEAISISDEKLLREVLRYRDYQRAVRAANQMREELQRLKEARDFYAEMSWEFSSWLPFVSKLCPSDTYKIYKSGSSVRIDTTLVGFEGHSWQRGNQTYIFRLNEEEKDKEGRPIPQVVILDHQAATATIQSLLADESLEDFDPPEEAIHFRMRSPIYTTYIDIEKIGFERSKGSLLFSWIGNGDKRERVAGHECKIFNASNVDLVTKTRSEHLSEKEKTQHREEENANPLANILNMVRTENTAAEEKSHEGRSSQLDGGYTVQQYLDPDFTLQHDIGKPRQVTRKSNSFKATLWLAEEYPLSLQEQVAPIVDLMSSSSAHFARLHSFMRLQLPAGFPVKIEIPLFHVVSARITFGKVNEPGPNVTPIVEVDEKSFTSENMPLVNTTAAVSIDPTVFEVPAGYRTMDDRSSYLSSWGFDEIGSGGVPTVPPPGAPPQQRYVHPSAEQQEQMLLQLAIEQSLLDASGIAHNPAPLAPLTLPITDSGAVASALLPTAAPTRTLRYSDEVDEERMLSIAIERSLQEINANEKEKGLIHRDCITNPLIGNSDVSARQHADAIHHFSINDIRREQEMLDLAIKLSNEEAEIARRRQQEEEDEILRQALERSLTEK